MVEAKSIWSILRVGLGWTFFWPFLDKLFGLGFSTTADKSWLSGVSPTAGFLEFGTSGPLASVFKSLAGSGLVDWLFMLGLLLIGIALILGVGVKVAAYSGTLMLFLMWLALLSPEHNPFLDEHILYSIALLGLAKVKAGHHWGLGKWWARTSIVKRYPFLE